MVISQSGETADTLAALRLAKSRGIKTIAVVNVVGSSIAREADVVLYTWAGLEIAVASTKAYFVQSALLTLLAKKCQRLHDLCSDEDITLFIQDLHKIPDLVSGILNEQEQIKQLASLIVAQRSLFFIGRSLDYALALEASLKLKEISYIHSEAYPAGELKHGTISLISDHVPVVALATQEKLFEKIISNIKEVKARGATVFLFALDDPMFQVDVADHIFVIEKVQPALIPLVSIIPLQLFAYYASVLKGLDVDKPRNLAKSVTVE
jgi:glucosamine--fructose-6-phosphate aminotransferase (isomerizing)